MPELGSGRANGSSLAGRGLILLRPAMPFSGGRLVGAAVGELALGCCFTAKASGRAMGREGIFVPGVGRVSGKDRPEGRSGTGDFVGDPDAGGAIPTDRARDSACIDGRRGIDGLLSGPPDAGDTEGDLIGGRANGSILFDFRIAALSRAVAVTAERDGDFLDDALIGANDGDAASTLLERRSGGS